MTFTMSKYRNKILYLGMSRYDSAFCATILHAYSMSKGTRKVVELDPIKVAAC